MRKYFITRRICPVEGWPKTKSVKLMGRKFPLKKDLLAKLEEALDYVEWGYDNNGNDYVKENFVWVMSVHCDGNSSPPFDENNVSIHKEDWKQMEIWDGTMKHIKDLYQRGYAANWNGTRFVSICFQLYYKLPDGEYECVDGSYPHSSSLCGPVELCVVPNLVLHNTYEEEYLNQFYTEILGGWQ